jgi:hypothetical protein
VVRDYPATEAQLAARDYLEQDGEVVPDTLIKIEEKVEAPPPPDTTRLTQPPRGSMPLGSVALADTSGAPGRGGLGRPAPRRGSLRISASARPPWDPRYAGTSGGAPSRAGDSPFTGEEGDRAGRPDSAALAAPRAPFGAAPDSLPGAPPRTRSGGRTDAPRDSLGGRAGR